MKKIPLAFVFCVVFLTGCATIIKGRHQEITINSNVSGALVEMDGVEIGRTPFTGKVKKNKRTYIRVSKPGYIDGGIEIKRTKATKMSTTGNAAFGSIAGGAAFYFIENSSSHPVVLGTSVFTGVFVAGMSTDRISSATWEYSPSQFYVQLKEENSSEQAGLDFVNELAIRYFATVNHSQIAIDAGKNSGEYATALANLMETKMDKDAARQSINEALEKSKGDQVLFGDELVGRFRQ
ncbi:MAG: PEGA domain-containing protein [Fibromonadaceae bacterium]|jgi:hypothetical protein|nr:PEGA domain-containing protein [Fibromonadaceae bacterium]